MDPMTYYMIMMNNNMKMNNLNNMNMNNMDMNNMNMNNMNMNNMNMFNMNMYNMNMGMINPLMMQNGMNMGMINQMTMQNGMNMGMMNPSVMGGMNLLTKEQKEERDKEMKKMGYLFGKFMAQQLKEGKNSSDTKVEEVPNTNSTQITNDTEITIIFKKGHKINKIEMKAGEMVAELLNKYYVKTKNKGPYKYKGENLDINDSSSLIEKGMKNEDEIIVGKN